MPNKLAFAALEVIRRGEDLNALIDLVNNGAALQYIERDPKHPRSRYRTHQLIVETYETKDFREPVEIEHHTSGGVPYTVTKVCLNFDDSPSAATPKMLARHEMFRFLLSKGAKDSENNWRGGFFQSVLRNAFWEPQSSIKFAFAQALVALYPNMLTNAAQHSYDWHGNPAAYQVFLRLGGNPTGPGVLANALRYVPCADGTKSTKVTRLQVVKELVAAGAMLNEEEIVSFARGLDTGWRGFEVPPEVLKLTGRN